MDPCTSGVKSTSTSPKYESEMKRIKGNSEEFQINISRQKSLEVGNEEHSSASAAMEKALDIHLVLQEIFKNLSPGDRRKCCEVSEKWRAIAGPMVFEYHVIFDERLDICIKTTKGYPNPQIQFRSFSIEVETKYLETQKRGASFMSLEFSEVRSVGQINREKTHDNRIFVEKFGPLVYKVDCYDDKSLDRFFTDTENHKRNRNQLQWMSYFPNCEELYSRKLRSFGWFSHLIDCCPMKHLKILYIGSMGNTLDMIHHVFSPEPIFTTMPNIQIIHGVPFITLSSFKAMKKLHVVSSIQFQFGSGQIEEDLEALAMRTMVNLGITFRFLRIGYKRSPWKINSKFIDRSKDQFENLLELGKDTLESVVLFLNRNDNQITFPNRMSALSHITFRRGHPGGRVHFPRDLSLAERFPKLDTISFMSLTVTELKETETCWGADGLPGTIEFLKGITSLRCSNKLGKNIEEKLLKRFPSVSYIEYCGIDNFEVDGIICK